MIMPETYANKNRTANFCAYCGYMGHSHEQSMRRGMEVSRQNTGDIRSMQGELSAIKKSLSKVDAMQNSIARLDTHMATLIKWQMEIVNPVVHRMNQTTESVQ